MSQRPTRERRVRLVFMTALLVGIGWLLAVGEASMSGGQDLAAALHDEAIVVDGHVHIVAPVIHQGIDPWEVQTTGLFDYTRAREGGLDVVVHALFIEDPYNNYNYAVKQAGRLIETFYRVLEANADRMALALTSADVRRIVGEGKLAAILTLEGGFDTEGDLDILRLFHRLGVRMIQLTSHSTTNAYVDAHADEQRRGGLTDHGRRIVAEMNRLGIIIDVSHASDAAQLQVIEASRAPVVGSHHGLRHFNDLPRNLSDQVLRAMAAGGGLMGMHSYAPFLSKAFSDWERAHAPPAGGPRAHLIEGFDIFRPPEPDGGEFIAALDAEMDDRWVRDRSDRRGQGYGRSPVELQRRLIDAGAPLPTVHDWAEQVDYVVQLVGDDHVGIGLDLMDGGAWLRDFDASSYGRLTEALLERGYGPDRVKKILGENWLRVLDAAKVEP